MSNPVVIEYHGPVACVLIDNPPVNATSQTVRAGLQDAIRALGDNKSVSAIVLACRGRTFIAGGDVREFDGPPLEPQLPDVIAAIENSAKPWIAAIHGPALGGGLEVALGCHYRLAAPDAQMGLPEVNLGLIPGAGGTVRLPRIVGLPRALEMIASGKPIDAERALAMSLIDRVIEGDLLERALAFAREIAGKPLPMAPLARRLPEIEDTDAWSRQCALIEHKARGQESPIAAVKALRNSIGLQAHQALRAGREMFFELKRSNQSKALRHIFFAERAAGKWPEIQGVSARASEHIGIVGGGTMGAGITAACLLAGLEVTLVERDAQALEAANMRVAQTLEASAKCGIISSVEKERRLASMRGSTKMEALDNADIVIEAVFEDMAVKKQVFAALDPIVGARTILASNTSYLDINELAASVSHPERVIGLHFFSPAHIMKLIEVVITGYSAPDVLAAASALAKRLKKIAVLARVCDGFIGNRIMSAYRRECDVMLEDGALPHEIDQAMRDFGYAIGVFEMQDMAGLDIAYAMRQRQAATRDPAERYVDIPDKICEMGRFGRKTGAGWYLYKDGKAVPDPMIDDLIKEASKKRGIQRRSFSPDEIIGRILGVMRQTGEAILDEGIARSAGDIDAVMVHGYGFPRWRGGPMFKP